MHWATQPFQHRNFQSVNTHWLVYELSCAPARQTSKMEEHSNKDYSWHQSLVLRGVYPQFVSPGEYQCDAQVTHRPSCVPTIQHCRRMLSTPESTASTSFWAQQGSPRWLAAALLGAWQTCLFPARLEQGDSLCLWLLLPGSSLGPLLSQCKQPQICHFLYHN